MARRDGQSHGHDSKTSVPQKGTAFSLTYRDQGTSLSAYHEQSEAYGYTEDRYSDLEARYSSAPLSIDHQQGTASRSWTRRSHCPPRLKPEMSISNATKIRRRGDLQESFDAGYNETMNLLLPQLQDRHGHSLLAYKPPAPFDKTLCDHYSDSESEDSSSDSCNSYIKDMDPRLNQVAVFYSEQSGYVPRRPDEVYYYPSK